MPSEAAGGRVVDGSVGAHLDENAFPGKARPPVVGTHAPPGPSSGAGSGFGSGHTPWQRVLAHLEQGNLNAAFHEALNSQRGSDSALVRLLGRVDPCLHKLTPETGGAVVKRLGSMVLEHARRIGNFVGGTGGCRRARAPGRRQDGITHSAGHLRAQVPRAGRAAGSRRTPAPGARLDAEVTARASLVYIHLLSFVPLRETQLERAAARDGACTKQKYTCVTTVCMPQATRDAYCALQYRFRRPCLSPCSRSTNPRWRLGRAWRSPCRRLGPCRSRPSWGSRARRPRTRPGREGSHQRRRRRAAL